MLRLNLLPDERKRTWALAQQLQQWRGAMMIVVLACLVATAALFTLDRHQLELVTSSNNDLQGWQTLNARRESGQVTKTTGQLNATVTGLQALFSPLSTATSIVASFSADLSGDIQVTNVTITSDGGFVLTGTAATRASFLALRAALDNNKSITKLATDSTASLREKVPFEYTGQLVVSP